MPSKMRNRADFNKLWFGQTVSLLGDRVSRLALPTVALLILHGTALDVGILAALRFLPFIVIGPIAGVWADRVPKRSLMIAADVGRMLVTATVPVAFAVHELSLGLLFVVAGVTGSFTVVFETSYQSYLPGLVGHEGIVEGNQKLQLSMSASEVLGASAGGVLIQILSSATAILVDALSFAASVAGLLLIKDREQVPERQPGVRRSVIAEAKAGLVVLVGDRRLRAMMLSTTTANLGASSASALVLVYCYNRAHLNPGEVGAAFAVGAVGLILGAIIAPRLVKFIPLGRLLIMTLLVTGVSWAILPAAGVHHALVALMVAEFLLGADMVFNIHLLSLVQAITPGDLMGRVGGSALILVWGTGSLGSVVGGALASVVGVVVAMFVSAAVTAAGSLFLVFSPIRSVRKMPASPDANEAGEALGGVVAADA
jgi:MFS family permease